MSKKDPGQARPDPGSFFIAYLILFFHNTVGQQWPDLFFCFFLSLFNFVVILACHRCPDNPGFIE